VVALSLVASTSEVTYGLIPKRGHMYASGPAARRDLPANTTANVIRHSIPPRHKQMFVKVVRRLLADWTR